MKSYTGYLWNGPYKLALDKLDWISAWNVSEITPSLSAPDPNSGTWKGIDLFDKILFVCFRTTSGCQKWHWPINHGPSRYIKQKQYMKNIKLEIIV